VAIINYTATPLVATVYAADAKNDAQGGFTLLTGEEKSHDAGAWTSLATQRIKVVVPPRTTDASGKQKYGYYILPFTVKVPLSATPGDHVAGVLVSVTSASKNAQGANVLLDQRVGVRLFMRVAGALRPDLAVENVAAVYHQTANPVGTGSATVTFRVLNKGNVKLGGRMRVDVSGLIGRTASVTLPDLQLLLPGTSVDVTAEVPGVVPQIRDTATVTITPLKLPGDADPSLPDVTGSTSFWAIPWVLLGILAAVLAGLGLVWWLRRRRVMPVQPEAPSRHRVPVG
jgi:hypothetical protein